MYKKTKVTYPIYKEHKYNEIYNLYVAVTFFRPFGD